MFPSHPITSHHIPSHPIPPHPVCTKARIAAFFLELKQSPVVGAAIVAAGHLEGYIQPDSEAEAEPEDAEAEAEAEEEPTLSEDEEAEQATLNYKYALRRVEREYPGFHFSGVSTDSTAVATGENSQPCECGQGRRGKWPWQLQSTGRGFCMNPDCNLLDAVREDWAHTSLGTEEYWFDGRVMSRKVHEHVRKYRFRRSMKWC